MYYRTGLLLGIFFASGLEAAAQWVPSGQFLSIPVTQNCAATNGDIAVATPQGIFYCSAAAVSLNRIVPDAGHFYYVHEYGHYANPHGGESDADCWAAQQLSRAPNGVYYIHQWVTFWSAHGQPHPNYGSVAQRIGNVRACCAC